MPAVINALVLLSLFGDPAQQPPPKPSETKVSRLLADTDDLKNVEVVAEGEVGVFKDSPLVQVLIENVPDDLRQIGVTDELLQTEVGLLLRSFNIPLRGMEESEIRLYVVVSGVKLVHEGKSIDYSYELNVEVHEAALVQRKHGRLVVVGAKTWTRKPRRNIATSGQDAKAEILELVREKTKEFVNAYLEANPKKPDE